MKHYDNHSASTYLIKAMADFAGSRGLDMSRTYEKLGIDPGSVNEELVRVSPETLGRVWSELSRTLKDPHIGLHFGEALGSHLGNHFLMVLMKNSPTLERGLESLFRYHRLMTDLVEPRLRVREESAEVYLETGAGGVARHVAESALGLLATVLRNMTGDEIRFRNVTFTHDEPETLSEFERIFTARPSFNRPCNQITFHRGELDRAFPLSSGEFESYVRHYADSLLQRLGAVESYGERVSFTVKRGILTGEDTSLEAVSRKFEMSRRHLQNKLRDEGATFREILDLVRKEIAVHLLKQGDVLLCDIAFMLGFSEQSSFNHAFRKWTGLSPGEFRSRSVKFP